MRSGRNEPGSAISFAGSVEAWDMRSGRNPVAATPVIATSVEAWDMRSGRNETSSSSRKPGECRGLGYALWPEQWPALVLHLL